MEQEENTSHAQKQATYRKKRNGAGNLRKDPTPVIKDQQVRAKRHF